MDIAGKTVLITGSNRGIGAALVRAFLKHGVGKVFAGARDLHSLPDFGDARVVPVQIDITNADSVHAAVKQVGSLDILVNNAGVMTFGNVLTSGDADLRKDMDVNYYGVLRVLQAFLPLIEQRGGGVIANILSVVSLASLPGISGYSASKAAIYSATLAARAVLKSKNISVVGVFPGPIDTDMAKDLPIAKASTQEAAENIVKGIIAGDEDIFPDPTSRQLSGLWKSNPKGVEQFFANM